MNLGEYLKSEREKKGMTLEKIADITKISIRHLSALETGKLDVLPSRVFVKGFIKAYSKCIGLSPEDVILKYEEAFNVISNGSPKPVPVIESKPYIPYSAKKEIKAKHVKAPINIKISGKVVFVIIAAIVIALAAYCSSR